MKQWVIVIFALFVLMEASSRPCVAGETQLASYLENKKKLDSEGLFALYAGGEYLKLIDKLNKKSEELKIKYKNRKIDPDSSFEIASPLLLKGYLYAIKLGRNKDGEKEYLSAASIDGKKTFLEPFIKIAVMDLYLRSGKKDKAHKMVEGILKDVKGEASSTRNSDAVFFLKQIADLTLLQFYYGGGSEGDNGIIRKKKKKFLVDYGLLSFVSAFYIYQFDVILYDLHKKNDIELLEYVKDAPTDFTTSVLLYAIISDRASSLMNAENEALIRAYSDRFRGGYFALSLLEQSYAYYVANDDLAKAKSLKDEISTICDDLGYEMILDIYPSKRDMYLQKELVNKELMEGY